MRVAAMEKSKVINYAEWKVIRERQPGNASHPFPAHRSSRSEHHPVEQKSSPGAGKSDAAAYGLSAILLHRGNTSLIVDKIDPTVPELCLLNPTMFEKIIFVQEPGDEGRLYGLLACRTLMVLVRRGAFSLVPGTPGRAVLDSFSAWLERNSIVKRELQFAGPGTYELIDEQSVVNSLWLSAEADPRLQRLFDEWNRCEK